MLSGTLLSHCCCRREQHKNGYGPAYALKCGHIDILRGGRSYSLSTSSRFFLQYLANLLRGIAVLVYQLLQMFAAHA
jgi:hypothetical protein